MWNYFPVGDDFDGMSCANVRVALSARLDGEPAEVPGVDDHLLGCPACVRWSEGVEAVTASVRARYDVTPDLTARVLAAAAEEDRLAAARRSVAQAGRRRMLRWAVGVAAVVQLLLAIPALLTAAGVTTVDAVHTSREMASFDIAVAVGFLLAAVRPERARAFVPVAVVLSICLGMTSLMDISTGLTGGVDEAGHMVALLQAILLWSLGRVDETSTPATRPVTT